MSFKEKGVEVSFSQLSAGYRGVITIICDLIARVSQNQKVAQISDFQGHYRIKLKGKCEAIDFLHFITAKYYKLEIVSNDKDLEKLESSYDTFMRLKEEQK